MEKESEILKDEDKSEQNKEEIKKTLKENILKTYNQIKVGCCRNICFNIFCAKNILCRKSKYIYL
jgi:hypothetical protein